MSDVYCDRCGRRGHLKNSVGDRGKFYGKGCFKLILRREDLKSKMDGKLIKCFCSRPTYSCLALGEVCCFCCSDFKKKKCSLEREDRSVL